MKPIKKIVSILENLVKGVGAITPNFNLILEVALIKYVHSYRLQKAIASFGKWNDRKETSVDIVNKLRSKDQ